MTDLEIMKKARELISDPVHWTQEENSRNADLRATHPTSKTAVCWCSNGAVTKAVFDLNYPLYKPLANKVFDGFCVFARKHNIRSVIQYNDNHTHAEVLKLFDDYIKELENDNHSVNTRGEI